MKLKILRSVFLDNIRKIQNIVEKKHTLSILSNFLLDARGGEEIHITATDLEIGFQGSFPAEILEPGSVVLPARKSFDILRELPTNATISLSVEDSPAAAGATQTGMVAKIETERIRFRIAASPSTDYPALEEQPISHVFEIEAESLGDMVTKVLFAISAYRGLITNGALMSLLIHARHVCEPENTSVRLVATDGHRLAMVERRVKMISPENASVSASLEAIHETPPQVIISRRALAELRRMVEAPGGELEVGRKENEAGSDLLRDPVRVELYEGGVAFRRGKIRLTARALRDPFPEYDYVIPERCTRVIQVNRVMFLQALRRVSLLADEKFKPVVLRIRKEGMEVSSNTPEMGEAQEELPILLHGETEDMDIGFNARYLMDVCTVMEGEFVAMELTNAVQAALLRPWEEEETSSGDLPGYFCVIMPIKHTNVIDH